MEKQEIVQNKITFYKNLEYFDKYNENNNDFEIMNGFAFYITNTKSVMRY